ncbi:tyrosine--tRNA ligase [Brevibacterium sp. UMB1308A]|uniref:tyrosine--tRNA ligase n=1 Tax=Brevibacterium sp. UMB1308A TaxID=3050608 RepID=UPI00254B9039|nr:tyrosine--tRNA ligase [Brevibacterium sp. UMB1308A]MDK8347464.1 tyrosine--tRNA ligase [Brevibacterium sp. UMB1308B]MDK8714355.1 tyrosine--tRNA ligase [Brevibacterium sp. UMB1308A]
MNIFSDLVKRELVAQTTDEDALHKALSEESLKFYVGFDPTAPSLHMGNLVQILVARRLQAAGHTPYMLVGGATGLIGDPRMTSERSLNPRDVVEGWVEKIRAQIQPFLDFEGPNAATMVNNYDWTGDISVLDFLRDVGKHFSVNRMLAKEAVSARLNSDAGISFTEFAYQLLQGNDYLELYRRYGITLQTGGSDQWGNLTSGADLIRRVERTSVHAMSIKLITKADGTKFGKTETGTVWLDPTLTSPYAFSQFWLNTADADAPGYLKVFSLRELDEINDIIEQFKEAPHTRLVQKTLARDVTELVHGKEATDQAFAAADALFGRGELTELDEPTIAGATSALPGTDIDSAALAAGVNVVDLFVDAFAETGQLKSKGEVRKAIQQGGAYINNVKVESEDHVMTADQFLPAGDHAVALLRRGKKTLAVACLR